MAGRECYHCRQWIDEGDAHDCWTTTEAALTKDLPEDLRDAWDRLRETAADFGEQRIYASLNSVMFSRKACYCFVRPRPKRLEVCVFLGRTVTSPLVRRAMPASKTKVAHLIHVTHRDQVEAPLTDWMREAYDVSVALSARPKQTPAAVKGPVKKTGAKKSATKKKAAAKKKAPPAKKRGPTRPARRAAAGSSA
jgi:hypothetical protein